MTYSATWSSQDAQGRVVPAEHVVRLADASELAAAVNRRRLITYQFEQDFTSHIHGGAFVRASTLASSSWPFTNLRDSLSSSILYPPTGTLGGSPPSPTGMWWLWPEAGAEENKILVSGAGGVQGGEIGLFQQLNGTTGWTDAALVASASGVRAIHFNQLRQAVEWIRRGRWKMPVYFGAGIFSVLPDTPWTAGAVANNGSDELSALGYAVVRSIETPPRGPVNVTVRPSSELQITADTDCTVQIRHCLRQIDYVEDLPTWNEYDPPGSGSWSSPGGAGSGDSTMIGSVALTADTPGTVSGSSLAGVLQAIVENAEANFLIRRTDTGPETIAISGSLTIEFDLDSPPN